MRTNRMLCTPRVGWPRPLHARAHAARRAAVFAVALLACACTSSAAHAQTAVALSRFEPSERGSRFFLADSLELGTAAPGGGRPIFAAGVAASWAHRAHTYGTLREGERSRLVEDALYLHPGASVVLAPGARFALDVPVAAFQSGEPTSLAGVRYAAPTGPRIGDVRASFDLRLAGPGSRDREGVALAAGVSAWLPTGSGANLAGEDAARFGVHVASAARFGVVLASARVGYMYRPEGYLGGSRLGSEVRTVLGIAYADKAWTIGPELHGATVIDAPLSKRTTPVEVLAGAHRTFGSLRAGAGVGTAILGGLGAAHLRAALSLEWIPGADATTAADDRDRDGVPDAEDICPDVPGAVTGPAAIRGCPPPPSDRDRDGVADAEDACADVPGVRTGSTKTHGCPAVESEPPTPLDGCPGAPSSSGCPADTDGDGILDADDACPDVAGVRSDDEESNGCPPRPSAP